VFTARYGLIPYVKQNTFSLLKVNSQFYDSIHSKKGHKKTKTKQKKTKEQKAKNKLNKIIIQHGIKR